MVESAHLRGYGCSGFLFGLGGGISIALLAPGSRTTCTVSNLAWEIGERNQ
jgi:hypothetical protein